MNSALKPVLGGAGVPPAGGQASPAKGNVAGANHAAVGLPQGAQNSHTSNNLVGQNLTQHAPPPQAPPHAVPSMAPVSANMAQMAQNMSHHGNLSHLNQNSAAPANLSAAASPTKAPTTSSPLSLVQDKVVVNASQPLALTRTPEKDKKELDSTGHANGTIDSLKSATNALVALKPQNPEPNKDKQDISKTSPSTPKPPEKPTSVPNTPQKPEGANLAGQAESPALPKVATANEPSEKSPSKPAEPIPAPTADIAPSQSDTKPAPESANNQSATQSASQPEKAPTPVKQDPPAAESAKIENAPKVEEKKEEAPEKPRPQCTTEDKKELVKEKVEAPKKEDQVDKPKVEEKVQPKVEEKVEEKRETRKVEPKPKSTLKLATVTPPMRKRRQVSPARAGDGPSPAKKLADGESTPSGESRTKRNRTKVQLYQSPTPELTMATKLSASAGRATPTKPNDDKLIVFYKNEYLAVRNAEGGFYVCQAMQNVYRTSRKIKIRWLSQDKSDPSGETYKPDFYDITDMECVLTTLSLARAGGGGAQLLKATEQARASSILERALRAEQSGANSLDLTPEHPDGLDLSLYTTEAQLDKRSRKRRAPPAAAAATPPAAPSAGTLKDAATPAKKTRTTPKRSPKSSRKAKTTPLKPQINNNKRKSPGSTPVVASTSKTATAVTEKAKAPAKSTPAKRTPAKQKVETPVVAPSRGRRAAKETKSSPIVATPSTSTGKATRTPRKPPSRK